MAMMNGIDRIQRVIRQGIAFGVAGFVTAAAANSMSACARALGVRCANTALVSARSAKGEAFGACKTRRNAQGEYTHSLPVINALGCRPRCTPLPSLGITIPNTLPAGTAGPRTQGFARSVRTSKLRGHDLAWAGTGASVARFDASGRTTRLGNRDTRGKGITVRLAQNAPLKTAPARTPRAKPAAPGFGSDQPKFLSFIMIARVEHGSDALDWAFSLWN